MSSSIDEPIRIGNGGGEIEGTEIVITAIQKDFDGPFVSGSPGDVLVEALNIGNSEGTEIMDIIVNGNDVGDISFTLAPSEVGTKIITLQPSGAGQLTVEIGDAINSFDVVSPDEATPPSDGTGTGIIGGIVGFAEENPIMAAGGLGLLGFALSRRNENR